MKKKVQLKIKGMHCASCAQIIEKRLGKANGVGNANVNYAMESAHVEFNTKKTNVNKLINVVKGAGYKAFVSDSISGKHDTHVHGGHSDFKDMKLAKIKMWISWIIFIAIMIIMLPHMLFDFMILPKILFDLSFLILAFPVVFILGWDTLKSAFNSLFHLSANMDVLIMLGSLAAYLTGILVFFMPIANYAGISAMILTFHLTGRYIETKAKGRASQAIKKLLHLGAKSALVIRKGKEIKIPITEVKVGDVMIVKPGQKIPTDGIVVNGSSSVNESMATGESIPVKKKKGSEVIGATMNQKGMLKIKATKVGKDTFLSQVIKMVEEAQGTKVPIQVFADKVTSIFVPFVILIAILTFVMWMVFPEFFNSILSWAQGFIPWVNLGADQFSLALFSTIAVLVIACPCALGLATPTALMVGSGKGAENGILIRNGAAIQIMKNAKIIVFDKTGTITKGKPEVTDIITFNKFTKKQLLSYAGSVENNSEHPLAEAVVDKAKSMKIKFKKATGFKSVTGKGVKARIGGKQVLIGTKLVSKGSKVSKPSTEIKTQLLKLEDEAKTAILISIGGKIAGVIGIADDIKQDSVKAIRQLSRMNYKTAMITGDNQRTANAVAKKVGIIHVLAEVLPDGKVNEIKRLQKKYGIVAAVGDGINDAPMLTQAQVGIAIGTGTDIAIESSDITLVSGRLSSVVAAIILSRATFKKIKQNLFWAFFYNIIAIPVAMTGLLHPAIAEAAMAFSSVTVVGNANLLKKVRIK